MEEATANNMLGDRPTSNLTHRLSLSLPSSVRFFWHVVEFGSAVSPPPVPAAVTRPVVHLQQYQFQLRDTPAGGGDHDTDSSILYGVEQGGTWKQQIDEPFSL